MRLVSRPRRTETFGRVKDGLVIVSENFQRFFDELAQPSNRTTAEAGDTTPSVKGLGDRGVLTLQNAAPTNVSTFDDGLDLQEVVVKCTTGNTTFVNSVGFRLTGGVNLTPPANSMFVMKLDLGVWHQVSAVVTT